MSRGYNNSEKTCIYINPTYISKLEDDARRFEVLRKDGHVNMNGFYGLLINGYHEEYYDRENASINAILEIMRGFNNVPSDLKRDVATRIVNTVIHSEECDKNGERRKRISFRPNNEISSKIDTIKTLYVGNDSISQYFGRMLIDYCNLPMSKRERVIFKDSYERLLQIINSKKTSRITFKLKNSLNITHEVIPYKIVVGKEEMFNYLLCSEISRDSDEQRAAAFRLNRMVGISVAPGETIIPDSVMNSLDKMERYGPQYPIHNNVKTIVKLTDRGIRDYQRIYFGRPETVSIDENDDHIYCFECSTDQLYLYFRKFGENAEILAPAELRTKMKDFHCMAAQVYENRGE